MDDDLRDCGIVYAVTGENFFAEVRSSIRSLRNIHPMLPVTVAYAWHGKELREILSGIKAVDFLDLTPNVRASGLKMADGMERSRGVKINVINCSPYGFTLFLDSDTYVRKTLVPLFNTLREEDTQLVLTNEPVAHYATEQYAGLGGGERPQAGGLIKLSHDSFFNSGVFAFRDSVREYGLGDLWIATFLEQSRSPAPSNWRRLCDQSALNRSVNKLFSIPRKVLSNTQWNAQCKILNELYRQGRWEDIHIIHCKLVHTLGPDPKKLVANGYISRFSLEA